MKKIQLKSNKNLYKIEFDSEREWLDFRKDRIGASDAPIIMGTAKWKFPDGRIKTPYILWREKVGFEDNSMENSATKRGKLLEEPARKSYEKLVGEEFPPVCIINKKYPHLMASLDGLNISEDKAVEIKNCNKQDHLIAKIGKIPEKYFPQLQQQILVLEFPSIDYLSANEKGDIVVTCQRDEEYIKKLLKETLKFWKYVKELKAPPIGEDDYIERTLQWEAYARKLHYAKQQKKEWMEKEEKAANELKKLSYDHNSRFGNYLYTKCISPGRINYKAIPELKNVDLEKYTGEPIISWRLKKGKE